MNKQLKTFFVLALTVVMSVTSCLNETSDPNGGENVLPGNVESLDSQAAAMKTSVADVKSLQDALDGMSKVADADRLIADLATCGAALEEHIASIEAGADAFKATLEAMQLQKKFAAVIGEIKAYASDLKELAALEESVKAWIGEDFENLFSALVEESRIDALLKTLKAQDISVDAIISDVEAGLREEDSKNELPVLSGSVAKNIESASELKSSLAALSTELEEGYTKAIQSSSSETKKTLKSLNTKASALLEVSQDTLDELAASIAACETQIADLDERLTKIETDLETLVGMIQSLTFLSEYSEESAIAYYSMDLSRVDATRADEGKKVRNAESNFQLNYLVRPAAAASALADQSLWNNGLTVKGYEAPLAQLKSSVYDFKDLVIEGVTADAGTGLVTVTVTNAFTDKFYFKEVGAKVALSVVTGKTDLTSKFVAVQPKDRSGKVYAESLTLTPTTLTLQKGATHKFSAVVTPADVTDKGCVWNNYGTDLFSIDQGGNLTALKVGGPSPLEVTANATDEWGRELLVTCDVTVTPAFSIRGGDSVEHGESITLDIESPDYINPSLITWALDNNAVAQSYVQLTKDSDGKCVVYCIGPRYDQTAREYTPITIKCTIDGAPPVELTKDIVAIERQPKAVAIEGLIYDQDVLEKKKGEQFTIAASIEPASVNTSHFRIKTEPTWPVQQPMGQDYLVGQDYGTAEVKVIITDDGYNHYFYPLNKTVERVIKVNVEPYWIETISLPATVTLNPGNETSLTPEFTSDVDGHQPTNTVNGTDLIWSVVEQSEADVISITPAGFITANKVGTAKIRVTTTGDWTTKDKTPKYAECTIVVEKKADNAPKVGDYYYSDGTWGTDSAPSGKSVIGVVFSTTNATLTDSYLNPIYTHGLVVGFTEYNTTFGLHTKDDYNSNSSYHYFQSAGFPTTPRDDENQKVMGYTHTLALKGYRTARGGGDWAKLVTILDGLDTPTGGSEWYIPSFAEMKILKDIADTINSKLDAHGDPLQTQSYYWPSTLMKSPSYKDLITQPFNMSTGTWKDSNDAYDNEKNNPYPARVVFAF